MVDQRSRFGSQDPDFDGYSEDITGRARSGARPYAFGRSARQDYGEDESSPLFLSDSEEYAEDGDLDQWESDGLLRKNKSFLSRFQNWKTKTGTHTGNQVFSRSL